MVGDPLCGRSHRSWHRPRHRHFSTSATRREPVASAPVGLPALLDKKHAELKRRGVGRRCDVVAAVVGGDGVAAASSGRASTPTCRRSGSSRWERLEADSPTSAANSFAMAAALGGTPGSAIAAVCLEPAFAATSARSPSEEVLADARPFELLRAGRGGARRRARRRRRPTRGCSGPTRSQRRRCAGARGRPDGVRLLFPDAAAARPKTARRAAPSTPPPSRPSSSRSSSSPSS